MTQEVQQKTADAWLLIHQSKFNSEMFASYIVLQHAEGFTAYEVDDAGSSLLVRAHGDSVKDIAECLGNADSADYEDTVRYEICPLVRQMDY